MSGTDSGAPVIGAESQVELHLAIHHAETGESIEDSFGGVPLRLRIGDGSLSEGLEALLLGLAAGSAQTFECDGAQLFGAWRRSRLQALPRQAFPPDFELDEGQLALFDGPDGEPLPGIIVQVDAEQVWVDFNHPLSDQPLRVRVQILAVEA